MKLFRQFVFIFLFALPSYSQDNAYSIQIASTKSEAEARAKVNQLERAYYTRFEDSKGTWYRVQVGKFQSEAEAKVYAQKLQATKKIQVYFIAKDVVQLKRLPPKSVKAKPVAPPTNSRPLAPAITPSTHRPPTTVLITPNSTFTKITNEAIAILLNTIKTTESITEVGVAEQIIDNDGQFGRVRFRLKYCKTSFRL